MILIAFERSDAALSNHGQDLQFDGIDAKLHWNWKSISNSDKYKLNGWGILLGYCVETKVSTIHMSTEMGSFYWVLLFAQG